MYPTNNKRNRQFIRDGLRGLIGFPSAWHAHLWRKCPQHCWYCKMGVPTLAPPLIVPATVEEMKDIHLENIRDNERLADRVGGQGSYQ